MRKLVWIGCLAILCLQFAEARADDTQPKKSPALTGSLQADVVYATLPSGEPWRMQSVEATPRSVPIALGLSAAVPGLGQAYNKNWIRAGIYFALDAASIFGYFKWRGEGNDGIDFYEDYANQNWSPIKYAEWLNGYSGYGGPPIDVSDPTLNAINFDNPGQWTPAERNLVQGLIDTITAAERQSIHIETGAAFSHVLPDFGAQQYYELIGKYFQYAPGWDDYTAEPDEDPEDPSVMAKDAQFYYYSGIHADANTLLRRSSRLSALLLLNHVISAFDAALSARLHNVRLKSGITMEAGVNREPTAWAGVEIRF